MNKAKKDKIFDDLYKKKYKNVLGYCYTRLRDVHLAADMAQEVFINAYAKMSSFRGEAQLSTWLYSIAKNRCSNYVRFIKAKKRFASTMSIDDLNDTIVSGKNGSDGLWAYRYLEDKKNKGALDAVLENEAESKILRAIDSLPEKHRDVFTKFYNEGDVLSYEDLSKEIKVPTSIARGKLFRARKALREKILKIQRIEKRAA